MLIRMHHKYFALAHPLCDAKAPRPTPPPSTAKTAPATSATVAARLQQTMRFLDKDSDGKLSTAEAGERPFFKPADEN